jgi:hypothetical protein
MMNDTYLSRYIVITIRNKSCFGARGFRFGLNFEKIVGIAIIKNMPKYISILPSMFNLTDRMDINTPINANLP